jgi:hypothetical protein
LHSTFNVNEREQNSTDITTITTTTTDNNAVITKNLNPQPSTVERIVSSLKPRGHPIAENATGHLPLLQITNHAIEEENAGAGEESREGEAAS